MMNAETYFLPLRWEFEANANIQAAVWMQNYLKEQFLFYKIPSPLCKALLKLVYSQHGYSLESLFSEYIEYAWQSPPVRMAILRDGTCISLRMQT
jgi:hypothetical protein